MIDIHSHILPSVDDGSEDMLMSLDMARMYLENGIKKVIATPHYIDGKIATSLDENMATLEVFKGELYKEGLDLEVFLGNEVFVSMDIFKGILEEKLCSLNGTRYILIELPMFDVPLYVDNIIYELLLKGYIPIIAHPERNSKIIDNPNILYKYICKGALAQLNLPSLEGKYGGIVKTTAEILLQNNMIHFMGTDAHSNRRRSPNVSIGLEVLSSLISKEDFNKLTYGNAELLLENKFIDIKAPIKYQKNKSFFNLFKRKVGMF